MIDDENQAGPHPGRRGPLGTILLALGGVICILMTLEEMGGLSFDMPRSWYSHRALWLGAAVAALVSGFFLLIPPKGDERDTG